VENQPQNSASVVNKKSNIDDQAIPLLGSFEIFYQNKVTFFVIKRGKNLVFKENILEIIARNMAEFVEDCCKNKGYFGWK